MGKEERRTQMMRSNKDENGGNSGWAEAVQNVAKEAVDPH